MFSVVGIELRSGGRLMSVKLCILLVEVSFCFSASGCDFLVRLQSISRRRAVFCWHRLILHRR